MYPVSHVTSLTILFLLFIIEFLACCSTFVTHPTLGTVLVNRSKVATPVSITSDMMSINPVSVVPSPASAFDPDVTCAVLFPVLTVTVEPVTT